VTESVRFDRVAGAYDRTRGFSPEGLAHTTDLFVSEFDRRDPILDVGIGTGQLAIPLRAKGVRVVGIDLADPMLRVLREKPGGADVPVAIADATQVPFTDGTFGGAYLRWVLHLVPDWRGLLSEVVRVVRPGGVFLVLLGQYEGPRAEIQSHFKELVGRDDRPVGLTWGANDELDAAMTELGASQRLPPPFEDVEREPLSAFLDGIDARAFSWTWRVPDDELRSASAELRRWARERFGPLEQIPLHHFVVQWRAYDISEGEVASPGIRPVS